ncbi:MAG: hypothetical protein EOP78_03470 [Variovorax sp.]|nr:MAG: hypothetical protein EOP78_03470 [Variovorax sp.]
MRFAAICTGIACVVLQACTTTPLPPQAPVTPAPVQPMPAPPLPAAPPAVMAPQPVPPPLAPTAEAPRDPAVDPRGLCDGRAENARIQTTGPRGETLTGVCRRGANGWLQFSAEPRR